MSEYVVIFALLVVGAISGISWLDDRSKKEAENHVECVSARPVPDGCRPDPVTKPTLPTDPASPPTTAGDAPFTPSDDPAEIPPPPPPPPTDFSTATVPATVPNPLGGPDLPNPYGAVNPNDPTLWGFSVTINIVRPDPNNPGNLIPAEGSVVVFEYWGDGASGETQHLTGSCVSDAAGNCTFTDFNYGYADVTAVHVVTRYIATTPGADLPSPSAWDFARP